MSQLPSPNEGLSACGNCSLHVILVNFAELGPEVDLSCLALSPLTYDHLQAIVLDSIDCLVVCHSGGSRVRIPLDPEKWCIIYGVLSKVDPG